MPPKKSLVECRQLTIIGTPAIGGGVLFAVRKRRGVYTIGLSNIVDNNEFDELAYNILLRSFHVY